MPAATSPPVPTLNSPTTKCIWPISTSTPVAEAPVSSVKSMAVSLPEPVVDFKAVPAPLTVSFPTVPCILEGLPLFKTPIPVLTCIINTSNTKSPTAHSIALTPGTGAFTRLVLRLPVPLSVIFLKTTPLVACIELQFNPANPSHVTLPLMTAPGASTKT